MILLAGADELYEVAGVERAVDNLEVGNDAAEWVEYRVENQGLERSFRVAFGRRDALYDGLQNVGHAHAGLARGADNLFGFAAEQVNNLVLDLFGFGRIEVAFVEHGYDFQVIVDGHVEIRYGLGLDALRGIDNEQSALACCNRARHLVGKVDVSGGVNEVQHVALAVELVVHLNGVALDGDAAFALEVHVVEYLGLHVFLADCVGIFEQTVGQCALAVVNVGYYAKIADIFHSVCKAFQSAKLRKIPHLRKWGTISRRGLLIFGSAR